jgi:hypothetical protein
VDELAQWNQLKPNHSFKSSQTLVYFTERVVRAASTSSRSSRSTKAASTRSTVQKKPAHSRIKHKGK